MIRQFATQDRPTARAARPLCLLAGLALLLSTSPCSADVIYLKSGRTLEGPSGPDPKNESKLLVITASGKLSIPRESIERVEEEPEHMDLLRLGRGYLRRRKFDQAQEQFELAGQLKPEDPEVRQALKEISEIQGERRSDARQLELRQLDQNLKKIPRLIEEGKFETAVALHKESLRLNPSRTQAPKLAQSQKDIYFRWAKDHLDHLNEADAIAKLETLRKLDPQHKEGLSLLIGLYEKDPEKSDEVLTYWLAALKLEPDSLPLKIKVAGALFAKQDFDGAAGFYAAIIKDAGADADPQWGRQLRQCYETLHTQAANKYDFEAAKKYYTAMIKVFPTANPRMLTVYEYALRMRKIDRDDLAQVVELADWALANELPEYALDLYRQILRADPQNADALKGMTRFGAKTLADAQKSFAGNRFTATISLCEEIIEDYAMLPELIMQAVALLESANIEYGRVKKSLIEQAQGHVDLGNQYYAAGISYVNQLDDKDYQTSGGRRRVVNPSREAEIQLRRAIKQYQTAQRLDSEADQKYDLRQKINDANRYLRRLKARPRLPSITRKHPPVIRTREIVE
ncbi:tetratricopeptide repeat protein [Candidatus Sumerlaeota bacterium]